MSPNLATWLPGTLMDRLPPDVRAEMLAAGRPRPVAAGTVLVRQAEPRTEVYLLESATPRTTACVKVVCAAENGTEILLGFRFAGDVVGEGAGLRQGTRSATVTACTAMTVRVFPWTTFNRLLLRYPDAWASLARMVTDRLDWANDRRLDFVAADVPTRLARVLDELVRRHGQWRDGVWEVGIRLSQAELGMLIGAREDAVGKALRLLRRAGAVRTRYRGITILDIEALRRHAASAC
ncbi:Crp/Fnr family transcriptional regulator [Actinomadura napierensis]|uniref:Crp/Fnr family transcriptional regulator n=1 Tax=Actinomadura napierensis TaxID=267854 RepID=A0ABP5K965_9ACTN